MIFDESAVYQFGLTLFVSVPRVSFWVRVRVRDRVRDSGIGLGSGLG